MTLQPERRVPAHWMVAAAVWIVCVLVILVVAGPTLESMVKIWWAFGTFNHAFAVAPVVAWLVWRRRGLWLRLIPEPSPQWLPLLLVGAAGLLLSEAALVNSPGHFGLVWILAATIPVMFGIPVTRIVLFPLAYLFFMVPAGEFLMPVMMDATAAVTVWALRATGVPVYREGLDFVIPSGNWSVVEACSGIRYLIASACVGTLYAYLSYAGWAKRVVFIALSLAVPVVANWLRAYLIVMLGHLSSNRLAAGVDHLIYGWVFFGLVVTLLFMLGSKWADAGSDHPGVPTALTVSPLRGQGEPSSGRWGFGSKVGQTHRLWLMGFLCVVLAVGPLAALRVIRDLAPLPPGVKLPVASGDWVGPEGLSPHHLDWRPVFADADHQVAARYAASGRAEPSIDLQLVTYARQTLDHRLPLGEWSLEPFDDGRWQVQTAAIGALRWTPSGQSELVVTPRVLKEKEIFPGQVTSALMQIQVLRLDGQWMVAGSKTRWALANARLRGHADQIESWVLATEVPDSPTLGSAQAQTQAAQRLQSFLRVLDR